MTNTITLSSAGKSMTAELYVPTGTKVNGYFDVRDFGAVGDFDLNDPDSATDDLPAFEAALAAMAAYRGNSACKLIADGHFYLSDTLHLRQSCIILGSGRSEPGNPMPPTSKGARSLPGTWLVFPSNCDGIVVHTSVDGSGMGSGEFSALRDLTLYCKTIRPKSPLAEVHKIAARPPDGYTGHGVVIHMPCALEHVTIENFAGDGVRVSAGSPPADPGNADGFMITKVDVGGCGGNGFYMFGSDAHVGIITSCLAASNWGWGFWDESTGGNTFIACIGQGNLGENDNGSLKFSIDFRNHDYKSGGDTNPSTPVQFIACYTEAASNGLNGNSCALGGDLGSSVLPMGTFMLSNDGVAGNKPYSYKRYSTVGAVVTEMGAPDDQNISFVHSAYALTGDQPYLAFKLGDSINVAGEGWWNWTYTPDRYFGGGDSFRLPSGRGVNGRNYLRAPWGPKGFLLGGGDNIYSTTALLHIAATSPPATLDYNLDYGRTYETGDVVWNSGATPGAPVGWVCTAAGTQGVLNGGTTFGTITSGSTSLAVTSVTGLYRGAYIEVTGVPGIKKITAISGMTVTIDSIASAPAIGAIVEYSPTAFASFGPVENFGVSQSYGTADSPHALQPTERYVTVTTDATMKLPAVPVDGQTYNIKTQVGSAATTTVDPNGNHIDGSGATVLLSDGQSATLRYSASEGQWEMR